MSRSYAFFDSPVGRCAVAWSSRGLVGVKLPERDDADTVRRLLRDHGPDAVEAEPPPRIREAMERIRRLLERGDEDLSDLPVDLEETSPFFRRVYEEALRVGPGQTVTYGELARRAGSPGASRAVGQAMGRNPLTLVVPCHRVVASGGKPGGFSARGALGTKARLLYREGAALPGCEGGPRPEDHAGKGLTYDLAEAVAHLRAADPALRALIDRVGGCRLEARPRRDPFRALVRSIAYQQLTGKAAATILSRVLALYPKPFPRPADLLGTPDATLREAGLSRAKVAAVKDLAAKRLEGVVPTAAAAARMDDAELIERLTAVRGIGRWSVEMFLLFGLGRPDVWPVDDYGVQKGLVRTLGLDAEPSAKVLRAHGDSWSPFRSVAAWYLWRAAEGL